MTVPFLSRCRLYTQRTKLDNYADIAKIGVGAAVIVTGTIVETPGAKQPFEMQADEVVVEGTMRTGLPAAEEASQF